MCCGNEGAVNERCLNVTEMTYLWGFAAVNAATCSTVRILNTNIIHGLGYNVSPAKQDSTRCQPMVLVGQEHLTTIVEKVGKEK